jgi:ATP-binding cassette subfamily A (ABC1) protein 3
LAEVRRVSRLNDGLRVLHASRAYGQKVVVDDELLGVPEGEVFALLSQNGVGKTTLFSFIREEIPIEDPRAEIHVMGISLREDLTMATSHMGFCPQVDTIDLLTVIEHLRLYARIKGVNNIERSVAEVLNLMGLALYSNWLGFLQVT